MNMVFVANHCQEHLQNYFLKEIFFISYNKPCVKFGPVTFGNL